MATAGSYTRSAPFAEHRDDVPLLTEADRVEPTQQEEIQSEKIWTGQGLGTAELLETAWARHRKLR